MSVQYYLDMDAAVLRIKKNGEIVGNYLLLMIALFISYIRFSPSISSLM